MYSGSRLTTLWPHVPIMPLEELLPRCWQAGFVFTCLRTASRLRANLAADFGPHSIDLRWLWNHLRHNQFNSVFYPNLIRVDPMEQKTAHFIKIRVLQNLKPQKASTASALKEGSSVQNSTLSSSRQLPWTETEAARVSWSVAHSVRPLYY